MKHGTLRIRLAASKGRSRLGRLAWLAIMLVINATPKITFANLSEIPAIDVRIQIKGRGAVHVFQILEAAAGKAGLTCNPSVEDYERGKMVDEKGVVITRPMEMQCGSGSSGTIIAVSYSRTYSGQIELRAYYELPHLPSSIVKPTIDAVVATVEEALKVDPLIPAIEQTVNVNSYPVISKIK